MRATAKPPREAGEQQARPQPCASRRAARARLERASTTRSRARRESLTHADAGREAAFAARRCEAPRIPGDFGAMAPEERGKPWGGRFREPTHPTVERFTASIHFDRALARYDVRGSIAHARMLGATGLIPRGGCRGHRARASRRSRARSSRGDFPFDAALEDIHMNVEARLRERSGPVAGRLHTGRSRNDQVATDLALYLRDAARAARARARRAAGGADRARARARRHACCRATRTCSAPSPCGSHTTGSPSSRCSARDAERFADLARAADALARSARGARGLHAASRPRGHRAGARLRGAESPTAWTRSRSRDAALEFLAAGAICDGAPLAPRRGAGALVDARVRLRRARRRLLHRLEPDAAEEEPRRAGAGARQDRACDRESGRAAHGR